MTKVPLPQQQHPVPKLRREIGGEIYDTATASVLFHHRYDGLGDVDDGDDEDDAEEFLFAFGSVLMLTVSDRYFVVDYNETGEPNSVWLRPVTIQEAVAWAELHCEKLMFDIFGRFPEAGEDAPAYTPITSSPESVLDKWLRTRKDNLKGDDKP